MRRDDIAKGVGYQRVIPAHAGIQRLLTLSAE